MGQDKGLARGGAVSLRFAGALQRAAASPWLIKNEIKRLVALPYIRLVFWIHGVQWGKRWRIFGTPIIQRYRGSTITLGRRLSLRSWPASNPLSPNHPVVLATRSANAAIVVGEDCAFTGAILVAAERIEIGDRVLLGANVTVTDTDFHPLHPEERRRDINNGRHSPVVIGNDVFIGMNSIVLKGVTIGADSVVGAGSVVTTNVPTGVIVAGNPARVLRTV